MMRSSTVQDVLQVTLVLACGAALMIAGHSLGSSGRLSTSSDLERLIGAGLSVVGMIIVVLWFAALALAVVAAVLQRSGRPAAAGVAARIATRCTPTVMRRLAIALVGVNLLAMPAVAQAAPSGVQVVEQQQASAEGPVRSSGTAAVDTRIRDAAAGAVRSADGQGAQARRAGPALPSPSWTPMPIPVDGGLLLRQETRTTVGPTEVVVAPGDSLWSIVAAHLGPLATSVEVAEAWPVWFESNKPTIGDDPSLLVPGQVLHAPDR